MTKLLKMKFLPLLFMGIFPLLLTSCDREDKNTVVKIEDINGNYSGKNIIIQGALNSEAKMDFSVKTTTSNGIIALSDFPIKEIVKSVVTDPAKATAAINALGKVKYDLNFIPKVSNNKTSINLTFQPKVLELMIPVDGVNKKTVITFTADKTGIYTVKTKSMAFQLNATKITVDGVLLNPYVNTLYNFPIFKKK